MFVADRALVEELITITPDAAGKIEVRAGASSRSRVLVDHETAPGVKEKNVECDFYLESGSCVDVFHVLEGESAPGCVSPVIAKCIVEEMPCDPTPLVADQGLPGGEGVRKG
jgi:hypothetical protein